VPGGRALPDLRFLLVRWDSTGLPPSSYSRWPSAWIVNSSRTR